MGSTTKKYISLFILLIFTSCAAKQVGVQKSPSFVKATKAFVQWQVEDSLLHFTFRLYRRDVAMGTSVGGPKLEIPGLGGGALWGIHPPVLEIGRPVLVLHGSKSNKDRQRMEFKVLVERRPNLDRIVGTE